MVIRSSEPSSCVGHEQPVERQQTRQQRAQPQDRRPEPRQQRQIRPHRKRHQHHHSQEEQHANQRPAADAKRDPDVPANEGEQGGHGVALARQRRKDEARPDRVEI
ncbi:hypothetical protein ACVWW2_001025 [Bradyrhizobium sp. LM4.3]